MADQTLQIIITAITKGAAEVKSFGEGMVSVFTKARGAVAAFNKSAGDGRKAVAEIQGQVKDLIGAFIGFKAITTAISTMRSAELASRDMAFAISAANKEFKDIGSVERWERTVRKLGDDLVIYSDTSLRKAVSSTIEMTKYLGLSGDQMAEVLRRSGDLAAGKMDLTEAADKVSRALSGESRGARDLGLVLRDEYVRSWYEANNQTGKAWGSLTELEKVQVRYNVFLEQTNASLGRSTEYSRSFAGSIEMVRKEIENAITRSQEITAALSRLGDVLKEHAGGIGNIVASLIKWFAWLIEFGVKYKETVSLIGGIAVTFSILAAFANQINHIVTLMRSLNAAWVVFTGLGIVPWLQSMYAALIQAAAGAGALGTAAIALAAAWGAVKIVELIAIIYEWQKAEAANRKTAEEAAKAAEQYKGAITDEHKARLAALKTKIESGQATAAETAEYRELLKEGINYYGLKLKEAELTGKSSTAIADLASKQEGYIAASHKMAEATRGATGAFIEQGKVLEPKQLDEVRKSVEALGKSYADQEKRVSAFYDLALDQAKRALGGEEAAAAAVVEVNEEKLANLIGLAEQERAAALAVIQEKVRNEEQAATEIAAIERATADKKISYYQEAAKTLQTSLDQSLAKEKEYAEKARGYREEAVQIEKRTADTIRELKRAGMTDTEKYVDREKEILEKTAALRSALAAKDYKGVKEIGGELTDLYKQQYGAAEASGKNVADVRNAALAGVQSVGDTMKKAANDQEKAAAATASAFADQAETIQKKIDAIIAKVTELSEKQISPAFSIDTTDLDRLLAKIASIPAEIRTRHVIEEVTLAAKRLGGLLEFARGGRLPGWGGGDSVHALLEPGEFVIKKEAVQRYGAGLFDALNRMRLDLPRIVSAGLPALAYAGGGFGGSAGRGETLTVHFELGGEVFSADLANRRSMTAVKNLVAKLNRGEYGPPY